MYFVYFIESIKNNKVYVGLTSKTPNERLDEHNSGSNIWTKQNGPFKLRYYEKYHCLIDAQNREEFYKTGFGKQIKYIILDKLRNIQIGA